MPKVAVSEAEKEALSHNLLGQRLGRKGRDTRERILAATERLLAGPPDTAISLSAVAREASLGMTTLYLYFKDLPELLIAVLEPIMISAEASYIGHLRNRWPDEKLGEHCMLFVESFHAFWQRHARILHLRNGLADQNDARMVEHRVSYSQPMIELFVQQMDRPYDGTRSRAQGTATVLLTGIERLVTIATDADFPRFLSESLDEEPVSFVRHLLVSAARLLELGIRDNRATAALDRACVAHF